MEDDAELEEGEACGDDTAFVDPDVALSYLDEKLHDVLGHFQKDFEGGVSAENLGSKFGGYGSFLPTYQRSPLPQTRCSPKATTHSSRSPYHQPTEGMSQNPSAVAIPFVPQNNGSVVPFSGNSSRRETCQSTKAERTSSTHDSFSGPSKCSDQNRFKVRIKVGSENVLARSNADIYSGLGLDISSPSSIEDSPDGCGIISPEFSNVAVTHESPRTILKIMTCFSIPGGFLLSPLHVDVLQLAKKVVPPSKKWETIEDVDNVPEIYKEHVAKKMKPYGKKKKPVDMVRSKNKSHSAVMKEEEIDIETPAGQKIVSEAVSIPLLSDSQTMQVKHEIKFEDEHTGNNLEGNKGALLKDPAINNNFMTNKAEPTKTDTTGCESSVFGRLEMDFSGVKGELKPKTEKAETSLEERNTTDDKNFCFLLDKKQDRKIKAEIKSDAPGVNFEGNKSINERAPAVCKSMEKVHSKDTLLSDANGENKTRSEDKRMQREQKMNAMSSDDLLDDDRGVRSSSSVKERKTDSSKSSHSGKKPKGKHRDVRDNISEGSYGGKEQDVFENGGGLGELRPREKSGKNGIERDPDMPGTSKREISSNVKHDRHTSSEDQKTHIPPSASVSTMNATPALAAPVVIEEHWVCCDICQRWRLLPYEMDSSTLPKRWKCSMQLWLPGMNRCDFSEDETTNALNALYVIPAPANGIPSVGHPSAAVSSGLTTTSTLNINGHVEQSRKRKNALSEDSSLVDGSHPTQASVYPMGNQHGLIISKSTADGNQHPIERDPVSKSVDLFTEKKRSKSKNHDSYSDGGDLMERSKKHSKVKSKREMDHDEYKTSKKIKKEERHHSGKDRNPVYDLASGDIPDEAKALPAKAATFKSSGERSDVSLSKQKHILKYNPLEKSKRAKDEDIALPEDENKEHFHPSDIQKSDLSSKKRIVKEWEESQHNSTTQVSKGITLNNSSAAKEAYKDQNLKEIKAKLINSEELLTDPKPVKALHSNHVLSHNGVHLNSEQVEDSTPFAGKRGPPELLENLPSEQTLDLAEPTSSNVAHFQTTAVTSNSSKASDLHKKKQSSQTAKSPVESFSSSPSRNMDKHSRNKILGKDGFLNANSSTAQCLGKHLSTEVATVDNARQTRKSKESLLPNDPILHGSLQVNSDNDAELVQLTQGHAADGISSERGLDDDLQRTSGRKDSAVKGSSAARGYNHLHSGDKSNSHTDSSILQPRTSLLDKGDSILHENKRSASSLQDRNGSTHCASDGNPQREVPSGKEKTSPKSNKQDAQKLKPQMVPSPLKESKLESHPTQVKSSASKLTPPSTRCNVENGGQHGVAKQAISNPTETSSPVRKDGNLAAYAQKEARDLKHKANRLKEEGKELESTRLYFEAALKFLHAASLLEPPNIDGLKQGDAAQNLYSDTAKLCNFVGHAYEKCKNMAAAALAYKCVEVAYLKAAYYKFPAAIKDRQVLQAVVHTTPGESPSSSASDIDNLNTNGLSKASSSKDANSPQVAGNQMLLAVRNQPHLMRLLAYTNDVNCAFDATRKSQMAIASAAGNHKKGVDGLSSVRTVLDFNFRSVNDLLRLVRISLESISC